MRPSLASPNPFVLTCILTVARFATHKTREATYAISKILEEMNRLDAAAVVVHALQDTSEFLYKTGFITNNNTKHQTEDNMLFY